MAVGEPIAHAMTVARNAADARAGHVTLEVESVSPTTYERAGPAGPELDSNATLGSRQGALARVAPHHTATRESVQDDRTAATVKRPRDARFGQHSYGHPRSGSIRRAFRCGE